MGNLTTLLIKEVTANCYSAVVTFSAENDTNSSVMLEGVHRDFPDWCERLKARGLLERDHIDLVSPNHITDEETRKYKAGWTRAYCTLQYTYQFAYVCTTSHGHLEHYITVKDAGKANEPAVSPLGIYSLLIFFALWHHLTILWSGTK